MLYNKRMKDSRYYDGTKLLSMKDINGETPEIFISTSNRTGGKTTYFSRLLVNRFIKSKSKFLLIYRYNYELDEIGDKFFKDIGGLFFPEYHLTDKSKSKGMYHELYLQKGDGPEEPCGYAVALNNADTIKKYSHFFNDVQTMYFDEFQSETGHYCSRELDKFQSLHTSIARGNGKQVRYVPVYMVSNTVSLLNPYYIGLGISSRVQANTKFLKGDGFVVECAFIESAANAQKTSAFNRAFKNDPYQKYAQEGVYLNDNLTFIEKPKGKNRYLATIVFKNKEYSLRSYDDLGIIYCDTSVDTSYKFKIAITTADLKTNYVILKQNDIFIEHMKYYFSHGCFRFRNLEAKEAALALLV